jgi:hypothetical protein
VPVPQVDDFAEYFQLRGHHYISEQLDEVGSRVFG